MAEELQTSDSLEQPDDPRSAFTDAIADTTSSDATVGGGPTSHEPPDSPPVSPPSDTAASAPVAPTFDPSLLSRAAQMGLDTSDPGAAFARALDQLQAARAQTQFAPPPAQPPAAPPPAEPEWDLDSHFTNVWNLPQVNPQWEQMQQSGVVTKDPSTGRWVAAPGSEWINGNPALAEMNAYEQAYRDQMLSFYENPIRNTWDGIQEPLQRMVSGMLDEVLNTRQTKQTLEQGIDAFERDNAAWMVARNDQNQLAYTPAGQAFMQTLDRLEQSYGVSDPRQLAGLALELTSASHPEIANQVRWGFIDPQRDRQAMIAPAQGGQVQPPAATPAPPSPVQASAQQTASFLDQALARAEHSPSHAGAPPSPPDQPGMQTDQELRNMFLRAYEQDRQPA